MICCSAKTITCYQVLFIKRFYPNDKLIQVTAQTESEKKIKAVVLLFFIFTTHTHTQRYPVFDSPVIALRTVCTDHVRWDTLAVKGM